jgi:hypothetical protein
VGSGLRLVEQVTDRLTKARAAAAGAWFGLLVGLFTTAPTWLGLILGGLLIGRRLGRGVRLGRARGSQGRRDFSSAQNLTATRYDATRAAPPPPVHPATPTSSATCDLGRWPFPYWEYLSG